MHIQQQDTFNIWWWHNST